MEKEQELKEALAKRLIEVARDGLLGERCRVLFLAPEARAIYLRFASQLSSGRAASRYDFTDSLMEHICRMRHNVGGTAVTSYSREDAFGIVNRQGSSENDKLRQYMQTLDKSLRKQLVELWVMLFENAENRVKDWFEIDLGY